MNLVRSLLRFFNPYSITGIEGARGKLHTNYLRSALARIHLVVILLSLTVKLVAQDPAETSSLRGRIDFKVGYFGNIFSNNGLNLGAEYLWKEKVKIRERRNGSKTIKHQLLLNGSLGYSTNFATQTQNGIFAYTGLTLRRLSAKNWALFAELNPLGVYRSILPTTYEVVDDNVTSVSFPGRSYYAPSVAIGIGRFRKAGRRSGWYLNLQYTVLTNYNTDILPITSVHFGHLFNLSNQ